MSSASRREERLDAVFHALSDRTRRAIVASLREGPVSVSELAAPFSMSLPAVSKHLSVLERAKLVERRRDGRFQQCHLTPEPLNAAGEFVDTYRVFWNDTLDGFARYIEQLPKDTSLRKIRKKGRSP